MEKIFEIDLNDYKLVEMDCGMECEGCDILSIKKDTTCIYNCNAGFNQIYKKKDKDHKDINIDQASPNYITTPDLLKYDIVYGGCSVCDFLDLTKEANCKLYNSQSECGLQTSYGYKKRIKTEPKTEDGLGDTSPNPNPNPNPNPIFVNCSRCIYRESPQRDTLEAKKASVCSYQGYKKVSEVYGNSICIEVGEEKR